MVTPLESVRTLFPSSLKLEVEVSVTKVNFSVSAKVKVILVEDSNFKHVDKVNPL